MSDPAWRASRAKRLQARLIAMLGYRIVSALGSTLRWRTDGLEHLTAILASGRQPVMVFWHGRILPATYFFRRRGIVVITSENFDGEWIAGIIERFGYGTARGSTSRGARKALLQLTRDMAAGKAAGFTVDGPRGPARVAQSGDVWVAKATLNDRSGRRSWTRTRRPGVRVAARWRRRVPPRATSWPACTTASISSASPQPADAPWRSIRTPSRRRSPTRSRSRRPAPPSTP